MALRIGIYDLWIHGGGGGEKKALVLADQLSRRHDVWLIAGEEPKLAALEAYFGVDLRRVNVHVLRRRFPRGIGPQILAQTLDRLDEASLFTQIEPLGLEAFLNCQWASLLRNPARIGLYMCMFPQALRGGLPWAPTRSALANRLLGMTGEVLDSYSSITANSSFTASWIQRLWGRKSEVVYSSCEPMGPPAPKEKIILHVGRVVSEGRADDKHQDTLLREFRKLSRLHREGWQLHFAGTVLRDPGARRRADALLASAQGLPVHFHFGVPFAELRALYRRASIYWHATGYGLKADQNPESQEHFGQTTVEAMSAGAVPVVIDSGGQREIVSHGVDGFLWQNLDGLAEHTLQLAGDERLCARLSQAATLSSARFSRHAFGERIERLIESLSL